MISFTRLAILSFCHQQLRWNAGNKQQEIHSFSREVVRRSLQVVANNNNHNHNHNHNSSNRRSQIRTSSRILTSSSITAASFLTTVAALSSSASDSTTHSTHCEPSIMNPSLLLFNTGYLNAKDAYELDQQLFSTGYTLEQLMELAGLAVAEAIYQISPPLSPPSTSTASKKKVLIVCGPGNNGGDGLVAARHLVMFGYDVVVVYPKRSSREEHYPKLVKQCQDVGISVLDTIPLLVRDEKANEMEGSSGGDDIIQYDVIVDAIFGFSFKGEAREPFGTIIQQMMDIQQEQKIPIVAVDVPSGWNVDEGDVANTGMVPDVLVSLTAPKLCSKEFQGRHFVGGTYETTYCLLSISS